MSVIDAVGMEAHGAPVGRMAHKRPDLSLARAAHEAIDERELGLDS
jgi:hypothetical protein